MISIFTQKNREHYRRSKNVSNVPSETFIVPLLDSLVCNYIESLRTHANLKALDVGCGGQPFKQVLLDSGYKYYSMDANQNEHLQIDYVCSLDEQFQIGKVGNQTYDLVICTEVLEHVADWNIAFENLSTMLSSQGKLLITCPSFYPIHEAPFDFWRPTKYSLVYFSENNSLKAIHEQEIGSAIDVLGTLLGSIYFSTKSKNVLGYVLLFFCKAIRKLLFAIIKLGSLQKHVHSSGHQLGNLFVFQKVD